MQESHIVTTLKWALIGAIVGVAVGAGHQSIAQSRTTHQAASTDGWRVTSRYGSRWPMLEFTVKVENVRPTARIFRATAKLIYTEYKGDPGRRVFRPSDTDSWDVETLRINGFVPAGKSATFPVVFRSRGVGTSGGRVGVFTQPAVTYQLEVNYNGQLISDAFAAPPAPRSRNRGLSASRL